MTPRADGASDGRRWPASSALVAALALWCAAAARPSPATGGDMSLLTMQRIKSYVDDTCTLDPHCQWTWDHAVNGLMNVTAKQAADVVPADYLYAPGDDAETPGRRGE